jgi:hypothetical protein
MQGMDTLLVMRGIIAAGQEKYKFRGGVGDVTIPLSILMQAADEICVARDCSARAKGTMISTHDDDTTQEHTHTTT